MSTQKKRNFQIEALKHRVMVDPRYAWKTWMILEHAIKQIYNQNASGLSFEELYRFATFALHVHTYICSHMCIILSVKNSDIVNSVTKLLYPTVAKSHGTTASRVERAIRHAIEVAWDRGDIDVLNSYFGYTIQNDRGKPTNSEFIAMISDKLRLKLKIG